MFANFANLEAFTNVFLHFLSQLEFLYMRLPESWKFSHEPIAKKAICETFLPWMILDIWYSICFCQVRCWSINSPKYIVCSTWVRACPLIWTVTLCFVCCHSQITNKYCPQYHIVFKFSIGKIPQSTQSKLLPDLKFYHNKFSIINSSMPTVNNV